MKGNIAIADELYKASAIAEAPKEITKIFCARNDRASFQIFLDAEHEACRVNTGSAPALGMHVSRPVYRVRVTAPFEVRLYVEKYLPDAHGVPFAEILDDAPNGDFDGNVPPAVWADILVPADAKAGRYSVTIDAYVCVGATNERLAAHRELTLEVYPCALPSPRDYTIYLDLWQHNSNLARYYGTELWSDEHFAVMEKAVKTLAELGQKSVTVLLGDCPWRGWGCYLMQSTPAELYEYSMARVVKKTNGNFSYDFSAVERYVNLCEKYGMTGDISVYGLLGIWKMPYFPAAQVQHAEQVLIRYLDETDGAYRYIEKENDLAAYLAAAFNFFKTKGWFEKTLISGDEPSDMTAYRKSMEFIKNIEPNAKFKLALDHASVIEEFADSLNCCAASFPCTCKQRDFLLSFKGERRKLLFYVCNIPDHPNTVLKSRLLEAELLGVLAYKLNFDGFLRWAHYCWTKAPLENISYNTLSLPSGDVCFVYPNRRGGFLLSLRYKALQRGIQHFELLKRVPEQTACRLAEAVLLREDFSDYMLDDRHASQGIYSEDPTRYEELRRALLAAFSEVAV